MSEDNDNEDARDEKANVFPPNTLAWVARAYAQKRKPIAPPWRILPRTVPVGQFCEAQALMDAPMPEPGMPMPNHKGRKA